MIITDTPGDVFDKLAMDIMGSLAPTKRGYTYYPRYTHKIHCHYTS